MFCPNCGKEIQDGAKFCANCGTKVEPAGAVPTQVTQEVAPKNTGKKVLFILVLLVCALVVGALAFMKMHGDLRTENDDRDRYEQDDRDDEDDDEEKSSKSEKSSSKKKGGSESYEDVIDALFEAAFDNDPEAVAKCFPKEMDSYVKKLYNAYLTSKDSGWDGDNLNYTTGAFFAFDNLDPDTEYSYEIVEATDLEESPVYGKPSVFTNDMLESEYGLTFDEAYIVEVNVISKYSDGNGTYTGGGKGYFEVAKIDGDWYVLRLDDIW